jgi:crotonobetainyl-CoA:carnitine CoA-transferase CaiB-like acyl-CoA transferase
MSRAQPTGPLAGIKVVEVSQYWFVPAAAALLAEWGADVIKVEHPTVGDPMRGMTPHVPGTFSLAATVGQPNRGKRSVGIDLKSAEGRAVLMRLLTDADVFITSYLTDVRQRLGIDVDDLRAVNPNLIYARGSGQGVRGDEATNGGFDAVSFWARGTVAHSISGDGEEPARMRGAMGDSVSGLGLAGGITAALFARERTGEAPVVDLSLLASSMWMQSQEIALTSTYLSGVPKLGRADIPNPLTTTYETSDGRWIQLCMLQPGRFWAEVCRAVGRVDLAEDPRFVSAELIVRHAPEAIAELDAVFAGRTVDEWRIALKDISGAWTVVQTPAEILEDPQALANGYLMTVEGQSADSPIRLVGSPIQFDESPRTHTAWAPDSGADTDEVLLEHGYSWDELIELKTAGATT